MSRLPWIEADAPVQFPNPQTALDDPNGLLAAGGDLSPQRLLTAYRQGIFPWFDRRSPILWWSPNPRLVIYPGHLHVSRRLRRTLRRMDYQVSLDRAFDQVIAACADVRLRRDQDGTWITESMRDAFQALHRLGHAHSVEVWRKDELIGGLYGVAIGRVFFGESMFSRQSDGSKIAMAWLDAQLAEWGFALMDCQVENPHLLRMGALTLSRPAFLAALDRHTAEPGPASPWQLTTRPEACRRKDGDDEG
ncbi:leucyl/phenylalanyl-tRNA--protein transferase [Natronospira bacteriovora]|uniref:Leucyl/phenylalanyl-tRNA--protein transferase n=1 Tax=Natronospira bacteriovora TaxID=3069753 RepID=A0ABU0W9K0_9GAMM|nr:leucyl/phenylalanyl-tRNA--protein transferase [Natronospira sp. AB-CW4]MDQ2070711.1 leucyl/phenylalanyl-tRNA--protein transferase [Natronospira sp. AB-CW4]